MSPNRIMMSFSRYADAELSAKAKEIESSMSSNPKFAGAGDTLTKLATARTEYDESLVMARTGDTTKIALKNERRKILIEVLTELARYVEMVAKGNRAVLLSSGFEISKEHPTAVILDVPQNLKLSDGNESGELYLTINSVNGAKSYMYQSSVDPLTSESTWISEPSTVSDHTFKSLPSGKRIWCRVVAIGSNNQHTVSDPVSRIVQ